MDEEQLFSLSEQLAVAARLRECLRFDAPSTEVTLLEASAREAADAIESLVQYVSEIDRWKSEGERLLGCDKGLGFAAGEWWADRPWRDRGCGLL